MYDAPRTSANLWWKVLPERFEGHVAFWARPANFAREPERFISQLHFFFSFAAETASFGQGPGERACAHGMQNVFYIQCDICLYVYVCMHVCMYACMYVCTHACM